MAGGINIDFVANVAKFIKGTGDIESSLDDVIDSLDDVARSGKDLDRTVGGSMSDAAQDVDKVSDALKDVDPAAKDAGRSVERMAEDVESAAKEGDTLEKKFSEAFKSVRADADRAGDDIGKSIKRGSDKASREMDDFRDDLKSSANQSGQEIAGTFTNGFDAESIADGITEVLGEATENLSGPMQVAGLAAAAAFALAYGELNKIAEKVNENKEAAGEFANQLKGLTDSEAVDALMGKFDDLSTTLVDARSAWEVWQEDAVTSIEAIAGAMEAGTLSAESFGRAFYESDLDKRLKLLSDLQADLNDKWREAGGLSFWEQLSASAAASEGNALAQQQLTDSMSENVQVSEDAKKAIADLVTETEAAVEIEKAQAAALGLTVEEYKNAQKQSEYLTEALEDGLVDAHEKAEIAARNDADAQREFADEAANARSTGLDLVDALAEMTETVDENGTSLNTNTQKGRDNQRMLLDLTSDIKEQGDAVLEQTGSQQKANKAMEEAAEALYANAVQLGFNRKKVAEYISEITGIPKEKFTDVEVSDKGTAKETQDVINGIDGKSVDVNVYADTSAVYDAFDRIAAQARAQTLHMDVKTRRVGGFYK